MASRSERRGLVLLLAAALACCGYEAQETIDPGSEPRTGTLTLSAPPEQILLPGTGLRLAGTGFQPETRARTRLYFVGESQLAGQARRIQRELPITYTSATELLVRFDPELIKGLAGGEVPQDGAAPIAGSLRLEMEQGTRGFTRTAGARFTLRMQLTPTLASLAPPAVYLSDAIVVQGDGLLTEGEGQMIARLEGVFGRQIYAGERDTSTQERFVEVKTEQELVPVSRTQALLPIRARTLGILPGTFVGTVSLTSKHVTGVGLAAKAVPAEIALLRTQLSALSTVRISRGQRVYGTGAGFVPLDPAGDTATIIRLSGTFAPRVDGALLPEVPTEISLLADVLDGNRVLFVPRPFIDGDTLVGLGAIPGRFTGSVVPIVVQGARQQAGFPLPCGNSCVVEIAPPKQVLFVKFLPNFIEGLRRFGLRNVEPEVRARALLVTRRTYARWNIEVRDSRPEDYEEFTTIEVGGPDPNGAGLFGLDNTEGKDENNLRLNDYIGGFNAIADVEGSFAFGGVFIESFLSFSLRVKGKKNVLATERFDQIFAPFAPELGGRQADRAELSGGPRQGQVEEAARVMGTLVGNTIAHEFGHSLGMSVGPGSHNPGDNDRELMDAGQARSFLERAELDEYRDQPSGFGDGHQAYLDKILPR